MGTVCREHYKRIRLHGSQFRSLCDVSSNRSKTSRGSPLLAINLSEVRFNFVPALWLDQFPIDIENSRPASSPVQKSISLGHPAVVGDVVADASSNAARKDVTSLLKPTPLMLPNGSKECWRWFIGKNRGNWIQENAPVLSAGYLCFASRFDFRC